MLGLQNSQYFSGFLKGNIDPQNFESWLFQHPELNLELGEDLYAELIALDFSKPGIRYECKDLVAQHIDFEIVQRIEIVKLLEAGLKRLIPPLELFEHLHNHAMSGALGSDVHELVGNFNEMGKSPLMYLAGLDAPRQWEKLDEVAPDFGDWMEKMIRRMG